MVDASILKGVGTHVLWPAVLQLAAWVGGARLRAQWRKQAGRCVTGCAPRPPPRTAEGEASFAVTDAGVADYKE